MLKEYNIFFPSRGKKVKNKPSLPPPPPNIFFLNKVKNIINLHSPPLHSLLTQTNCKCDNIHINLRKFSNRHEERFGLLTVHLHTLRVIPKRPTQQQCETSSSSSGMLYRHRCKLGNKSASS